MLKILYTVVKTTLQMDVVWCYMLGMTWRNEVDMISKKLTDCSGSVFEIIIIEIIMDSKERWVYMMALSHQLSKLHYLLMHLAWYVTLSKII